MYFATEWEAWTALGFYGNQSATSFQTQDVRYAKKGGE